MREVKALIISGYGINCERETALACQQAGAATKILHAGALLENKENLDEYQLLVFPGGFSFGDDLGAGKALANRLSYSERGGQAPLKGRLIDFVERGGCILGICNGFQLLVKLGLLPGVQDGPSEQRASLAANDSCRFEDRWVHHSVLPSRSIFTTGLSHLFLPVRHGEGKCVFGARCSPQTLIDEGYVPLQYATPEGEATQSYPCNPNGSTHAIAAMCDRTGRILGMMAHPEAALFWTNTPFWTREKEKLKREGGPFPTHGPGIALFKNAVTYIKKANS